MLPRHLLQAAGRRWRCHLGPRCSPTYWSFLLESGPSHTASRGGHARHNYGLLRTQRSCRPLFRSVLSRDRNTSAHSLCRLGCRPCSQRKNWPCDLRMKLRRRTKAGRSPVRWCHAEHCPCAPAAWRGRPVKRALLLVSKSASFSPLNYGVCHTRSSTRALHIATAHVPPIPSFGMPPAGSVLLCIVHCARRERENHQSSGPQIGHFLAQKVARTLLSGHLTSLRSPWRH